MKTIKLILVLGLVMFSTEIFCQLTLTNNFTTTTLIKEPIIRDPIIKVPIIKDPIIIDPIFIPPIFVLNQYEKHALPADGLTFARFNQNDTVDYVSTDSLTNEIKMTFGYDTINEVVEVVTSSSTSSTGTITTSGSSFSTTESYSTLNTTTSTTKSLSTTTLSPALVNLSSPTYTAPVLQTYQVYSFSPLYLYYGFLFEISEPIFSSGIPNGSISVGDFNNDNKVDFLTTGVLYRNNTQSGQVGVFNKAQVWLNVDTGFLELWKFEEPIEDEVWVKNNVEDYNNDGLQDLDIGGRIFLNEGLTFQNSNQDVSYVPHKFPYKGEKIYMDYNGDSVLDYHYKDTLYINKTGTKNTPPEPPVLIDPVIFGDTIIFSWHPASDNETSITNLTYNIMVGTTNGGTQVVSPLAIVSNGKRKVFQIGNCGKDTVYKLVLEGVISTTLHWSVQTIDGQYMGSQFAPIKETAFSKIAPFIKSHVANSKSGRLVNGSTTLFDANNDNKLDLLTSGNFFTLTTADGLTGYGSMLRMYYNSDIEDFNNFLQSKEEVSTNTTSGITQGFTQSVTEVLDYNNDGNIDFVICGNKQELSTTNLLSSVDNPVLALYRNTNPGFTEIILDSIAYGDIACGDIDNDGDEDILVCGTWKGEPKTFLYVNNNKVFKRTELFQGITNGNVLLIDYDNDRDLDVLLTGSTGSSDSLLLYNNKGGLKFQLTKNSIGFSGGDAVACDLNNDKFIDFVVSGENDGVKNIFVYQNNAGNGFDSRSSSMKYLNAVGQNTYNVSFKDTDYPITGRPAIEYGDFNNDGHIDLCIVGSTGKRSSYLYLNQGKFEFKIINYAFPRLESGSIDMGDLDNDGDLDLYIQGYNGTVEDYGLNNELYINNTNLPFDMDTVKKLNAEMDGLHIALRWEGIYDEINDYKAYTYNIKIGTHPDSANIIFPMSDIETGYRRVTKPGNVLMNNQWSLQLPPGKYYWGVQAVNASFIGGPWSEIDSFIVTSISPEIAFENVCLGDTTSFFDQSLASPAIVKWQWDFGDGATSNLKNPKHLYNSVGQYVFSVLLNNGSDSVSVIDTAVVYKLPDANFTVAPVCEGQPSTINNISDTNKINVEEWIWTFRNDQKSYIKGDVEAEYAISDFAYLEIETDHGCYDIDSQWVEVAVQPTALLLLDQNSFSTFCNGENAKVSIADYNADFKYYWTKNSQPINVVNKQQNTIGKSGSYGLIAINPIANCADTSGVLTISVVDYPTIPVFENNLNTLQICPGDKVLLEAKNPGFSYDYQWYYNGVEIPGKDSHILNANLVAGSYKLIATNDDKCSSESDVITISLKDNIKIPTLDAVGPNIWYLYCSNDSAKNYSWYYNGQLMPEEKGSTYMAKQKLGKYQVVIDNGGECSVPSDPLVLTKKGIVGLADIENESEFYLSPNPSNGLFILELENHNYGNLKMEVFQANGGSILQKESKKTSASFIQSFDLSNYEKGVYFVKLSLDDKQVVKKIVIH